MILEGETMLAAWASRHELTMPDRFHIAQFYMAGALAALSLLLYTFGPHDKAEVLAGAAMTLIGFLVGKASNGFGRRRAE